MKGSLEIERANLGFALSLIASLFVLINGVVWFLVGGYFYGMGLDLSYIQQYYIMLPFHILGAMGIVFALGIFFGALAIYLCRNKSVGGIIVMIFSILSISVGGGFLIGLIFGILGGAFGRAGR